MKWVLVCAMALLALPVQAETLVTGLSRDDVQITANFDGSDILVYGAVRREKPAPNDPRLHVIVTLEGPAGTVLVRRKERRFGIWVNGAAVEVSGVPSFYAIASTGALDKIVTPDENLRHDITLDRRANVTRISADTMDFPAYTQAMNRVRTAQGYFQTTPSRVRLAEDTLFRADFVLPANLVEGDYRVRLFLLRGGVVLDTQDQIIDVRKTGIEQQLTVMSQEQPLLYGVLSLLMAAVAGWAASAGFRLLRR